MGYDLTITRSIIIKNNKLIRRPDAMITSEEWMQVVADDPTLELYNPDDPYTAIFKSSEEASDAWLDWREGEIYAKNPSEELIDKMVNIARLLNATVIGDDGEYYIGSNCPPRFPSLSLKERLKAWFNNLNFRGRACVENEPLPFKTGDRVVNVLNGLTYVVLRIDPNVDALGRIYAQREDGVEEEFCIIGSGLLPVEKDD